MPFWVIRGIYSSERLPGLKIYLALGLMFLASVAVSAVIYWARFPEYSWLESLDLGLIGVTLFFAIIWLARIADRELSNLT